MPTPTRKYAIASADVFDVASGDPLVTDYGFSRLDILEKDGNQGAISCFPNGAPKLEFMENLGLTLKPYLNPVDMRASQHICTPSGSWDEIKSVGGSKDVFHLRYSDMDSAAWTVTSNYNISANPVFGVSLIIPETSNTWDFTNNEPFIRIEFGNGKWAVLISKQYGSFLLANPLGTGNWVKAADLESGFSDHAHAFTDEKWVIIRCEFGGISISMDLGKSWQTYNAPDGSIIAVPAGPFKIVGQGISPIIGLGEFVPPAFGDYLSAQWDSFDVRSPLSTPIITGHYTVPAAGGAISFFNLSQPASRMAQYGTRLSAIQIMTFPFRMWNSPLLQNVTLRFTFQRATTSGHTTTPWNAYIIDVDLKESENLSDATCTLKLQWPSNVTFSVDGMRWRKVRVKLGYKLSDNTDELHTVFTGYIASITMEEQEFGSNIITIELVTIAAILKRKRWNPLNTGAFAGMTPQAAGDFILKSEGFMDEAGIDRTYANWFTASLGTAPMPLGEWNRPFETIKGGEDKFTTLSRIFDYYGFEISVDENGVLVSLPKNYVSPTTDHTLYINDVLMLDDIRKQVKRLENNFNYRDSATAVMVYGKLSTGQLALIYAIDNPAETDTSLDRFSPFRDWIIEEFTGVHGRPDNAMILEKLSNIARDNLGLKKEPNLAFAVKVDLKRRAGIVVNGCDKFGIPTGTKFTLMTRSMHFKAQQGLGDITLNAGLRRLINQT